jgi:hypothetical protein
VEAPWGDRGSLLHFQLQGTFCTAEEQQTLSCDGHDSLRNHFTAAGATVQRICCELGRSGRPVGGTVSCSRTASSCTNVHMCVPCKQRHVAAQLRAPVKSTTHEVAQTCSRFRCTHASYCQRRRKHTNHNLAINVKKAAHETWRCNAYTMGAFTLDPMSSFPGTQADCAGLVGAHKLPAARRKLQKQATQAPWQEIADFPG